MKLLKYLKIFTVIVKASLMKELYYRFNIIMSLLGSFCFIAIYMLTLIFLLSNVKFGNWTTGEIWLLLGVAIIIYYGIFFLFWRGLVYLGRDVINGNFDFYLLRPIDSQFISSIRGGGLHNILALIFGIGLTIIAINNLHLILDPLKIFIFIMTIIVAMVDFYNLLFGIVALSFKYGNATDLFYLAFNFQEFMRYPIDAYIKSPLILAVFAVPFSAMTTVPVLILKSANFPWGYFAAFIFLSVLFALFIRHFWLNQLKSYTSGN